MTIQTMLLEGGIAIAILGGACGSTWFAADAHYSKALSTLEGQLEEASKAQKAAVAAQIKMDQDAAKEVDDATKQQIGTMAATISDLSGRLQHTAGSRTVTVRAAPASAPVACVQPDRPAVAASDRPVPKPPEPIAESGPAGTAAIPSDVLNGVLEVGKDALKAELLYREYLRKTGQTK